MATNKTGAQKEEVDFSQIKRATRSGVKRKELSPAGDDAGKKSNIVKQLKDKSVKIELAKKIKTEADEELAFEDVKIKVENVTAEKANNGTQQKKAKKVASEKPLLKEEPVKLKKAPQVKKKAAATKATAGGAPKPELVIPDINIPLKGEIIPKMDGPSPHNGTIQYSNKIFLGAHISAAGIVINIFIAVENNIY